MNQEIRPPRFALKILKWYCNEKYLEEIEGDLYELYEKRIDNLGIEKARKLYYWDVVRFFRFLYFKRQTNFKNSNSSAMIKNYFKIGFRNILKRRLTSSINMIGLSVSISIAIVSFLWLDWQYNLDAFHSNYEQIYQVTNYMNRDDGVEEWGDSPEPLGLTLKANSPKVVDYARLDRVRGIFRYNETVFEESIHFVDPQFLKIFDFPLESGNKDALEDPRGVVITRPIADKYFGTEDPIGKQITITFNRKDKETFFVRAVAERVPNNSSIVFNILIPYEIKRIAFAERDIESWKYFSDATFILTEPQTNESDISRLFPEYVKLQNNSGSRWEITDFHLQPLTSLSVNAYQINNSVAFGNAPQGNLSLAIIAILLLILACLNYMNIAIVSSSTRLKEIALRKVVGGIRKEIIFQFLAENLLLCFFSLLLGVALAYYFLLPGFNSLFPFNVDFTFSSNLMAIGFFGGLLLLVALASGAYPSLYISKFNPVTIFRGKQTFGAKGWLSKTFLTIQFIIAFMTIVSGFMFTEANSTLMNKDWGYEKELVYTIPIDGKKHYTQLKNELLQNSKILRVSGSNEHVGNSTLLTNVELNNKVHQVRMFRVDPEYPELMGFHLIDGRLFNKDLESDNQAIIVNQRFADKMNWENPIEETLIYDSIRYNVIGVVEDFHYYSFYNEIDPSFFRLESEDNYRFLVAKANEPDRNVMLGEMEAIWKKVDPDLPFEGFAQPEVFDSFFDNLGSNITVINFVSITALILSCMGLFGLVSFNINRRMKEFSIRKVMGASTMVIMKSVNKGFRWILLIAMIIGSAFGYLASNSLFNLLFPDLQPAGITSILWAGFFVFITVFITVSSQVFKVLRSNPVDNLRNE